MQGLKFLVIDAAELEHGIFLYLILIWGCIFLFFVLFYPYINS